MKREDLDPAFLVWSMHLRLNTQSLPPCRMLMEFELTGASCDCREFWLLS